MPWSVDLAETLRFYLRLCRRDQALSEANADPFYNASLALVESQAEGIRDQRHALFHEDMHFFVHKGRFQGFFDLEMCRLGTEVMQLERIFRQCDPEGLRWNHVLEGYQAETGRTVDRNQHVAMLAMGQFYYHIRVTCYGSPDREADYAAIYLPDMKNEARKYAGYVDVNQWLPCL